MKAVMLSIKPKWCELIANGKKTVEVRKTRPKIDTPFKCYIYCTYGEGLIERSDLCLPNMLIGQKVTKEKTWGNCCNGKVIGEFVCDGIASLKCDNIHQKAFNRQHRTCLTDDEIMKYANNGKVYYWNISNLVIYDKPKRLDDFSKVKVCHRGNFRENCIGCWDCEITRPPQSWMYVQEVGG